MSPVRLRNCFLLTLVAAVGIVACVFDRKRKASYERDARIPFDDGKEQCLEHFLIKLSSSWPGWPGLARPSSLEADKGVDARGEPAHDGDICQLLVIRTRRIDSSVPVAPGSRA